MKSVHSEQITIYWISWGCDYSIIFHQYSHWMSQLRHKTHSDMSKILWRTNPILLSVKSISWWLFSTKKCSLDENVKETRAIKIIVSSERPFRSLFVVLPKWLTVNLLFQRIIRVGRYWKEKDEKISQYLWTKLLDLSWSKMTSSDRNQTFEADLEVWHFWHSYRTVHL